MNRLIWKTATALVAVLLGGVVPAARAQNFDEIGVTLLRAMTTNLNGTGIRVAQAEAGFGSATNWEVGPAFVSQPTNLFTYISISGTATNFPNAVGGESFHADVVGGNFYGIPTGVATNIAHVDNYEADYFINYIIDVPVQNNINDFVVNQSFDFGETITISQQQELDSAYDNFAVQFSTLFVSAAGNGGPVSAPATHYNGLCVGVSDGSSSFGPTLDNGRSKPDLVTPSTPYSNTSASTPYVAGAAAVLLQAGLRGDGGADTNSAADIRTLRALLINGAVKPIGWTNSVWTNNARLVLDTNYGAGVLNVFNSYEQLASGKHGYIVAASVPVGNPHPPTGATGTVSTLSGWDFDSISSTSVGPLPTDGVNHYYFNTTNGANNAALTATITLAWNRPQSASSSIHSGINNLNLFLYNAANSNLVACSTSLVDNVEHVFVPRLAPGRYDLQVWKAGGSGIVSASESYALAWAFTAQTLQLAKSGTNANLAWPAYPAGFGVVTTTNLTASVWNTNFLSTATLVNRTNTLQIPMTNAAQFFRLRTPNF